MTFAWEISSSIACINTSCYIFFATDTATDVLCAVTTQKVRAEKKSHYTVNDNASQEIFNQHKSFLYFRRTSFLVEFLMGNSSDTIVFLSIWITLFFIAFNLMYFLLMFMLHFVCYIVNWKCIVGFIGCFGN